MKPGAWGMRFVIATALLGAGGVEGQTGPDDEDIALRQLRQQRRNLAFRKRRIIANNDGCDVLYFPAETELTPEAFLDLRTTNLAHSQVGTIAYCTISSGFSFFTHNTRAGTILERQPGDYGLDARKRNVARDLIDQGADCLDLVTTYAHAHDMELFWSFRMNDTHDVAQRKDKPYLLFPPLKEAHPEWLVSDVTARRGRWSSVNYALPEIRDLAFAYTEEVCRTYDVDGIELDFFRHLCYFPGVAEGGVASEQERDMMTDLLRRIRTMTEQVGVERGRPILIAIRVPDSLGYNRDMGLDVETWLREGLIDMLITTGYFRLNPWSVSADLARRYGVAFYPCLSDSRVRGATRFQRGGLESFRARAANAWWAGADGIHIFNVFNPNHPIWNELGSPESLRGLDKVFFVTVRDGNPGAFLATGQDYRTTPLLTPSHPMSLADGSAESVEMVIGEDLEAARKAGLVPRITAHLRVQGLDDPQRLSVSLNGYALGAPEKVDDWLDVALQHNQVIQGVNRFAIALAPAPPNRDADADWTHQFAGDSLPESPWTMDRPATNTLAEVQDGALLIADRGLSGGDYRYYRLPWGLGRTGKATVEARVKVISGVNALIFGNGSGGDRLRLTPNRIDLHHQNTRAFQMDTTADFHVYRLEIDGDALSVFVDGQEVLADPACLAAPRKYRPEVAFGAASSSELGEALWDYVRVRVEGIAIADLAVSMRYPQATAPPR